MLSSSSGHLFLRPDFVKPGRKAQCDAGYEYRQHETKIWALDWPLYSPVTMFESDFGSDAGKPSELPQILQTPAFALLRGAQRAQQSSGSASPKWKRYPCQSPELIGKAGQTR
ncbi:hypothetical protein TruAng_000753 [Truncatella angustata]|nr:hypothetical protein TruAng_000753 [Truncatella angustata]